MPEQASTLGLSEIQRLIFEPGFSTAASVTETSGRGVGMDVVKTRIEQLGETVSVRSTPKRGCHITLTMPVSAAIQGIVFFNITAARTACRNAIWRKLFPLPSQRFRPFRGRWPFCTAATPCLFTHSPICSGKQEIARPDQHIVRFCWSATGAAALA